MTPEQLAEAVTSKPSICLGCGVLLDGDDAEPIRYQVAEVPPVHPVVVAIA